MPVHGDREQTLKHPQDGPTCSGTQGSPTGEPFPHVAWKMLSTELPDGWLRRLKCSVQTTATLRTRLSVHSPRILLNRTGSKATERAGSTARAGLRQHPHEDSGPSFFCLAREAIWPQAPSRYHSSPGPRPRWPLPRTTPGAGSAPPPGLPSPAGSFAFNND